MSPRARSAAFWTCTALVAFLFVSGGAVSLAQPADAVRGITELGYPAYFLPFLGFWKLVGGLTILVPRLQRAKEWAYAGIAFDLIAAAASHVAIGHPAGKVIAPLVVLAIAVASWGLRPADRRLPGPAF